jgi:hypothetical protein
MLAPFQFGNPWALGWRLAEEAKRLREQAELLPPGAVRDAVLQKALLTEQLNAWLTSAGLQPPK